MRFFKTLASIISAVLVTATATPLEKRATILSGSIVSPAQGSVITPEETVSFNYALDNWCEAGYTPISLWLVQNQPTSASLNSSQEFSEYIYFFGNWLINNFGLPPMTNPPPPPSTLIIPTLDASYLGETIYFAAIQTENSCPPDGHLEYGIAYNSIQYGST